MALGPRHRRPLLDRASPLRGWNGLYVPSNGHRRAVPQTAAQPEMATPQAPVSDVAPKPAAAVNAPIPPHAAEPAPRVPPMPSPQDAVARGVATGYRVIEEYLREGQGVARSVAQASTVADVAAAFDPRKLTERMVQHASDLAAAWIEYMQASLNAAGTPGSAGGSSSSTAPTEQEIPDVGAFAIPHRAPRAPQSAPQQPASPASTPRSSGSTRPLVMIDLVSTRRVASQVELNEGPLPLHCHAHALRCEADRSLRIEGVTVEAVHTATPARLIVRLAIPNDAQAGSYRALLLDADTNLPCGQLVLELFE